MRSFYFLAGFALFAPVLPAAANANAVEPVSQSVISKVKTLDIQGINLGMTIDEIKQVLAKQGFVSGYEKNSRKSYGMQYVQKGEGANEVSQTVTVRFYANMRGITDPHPYFIEYVYKYRPAMVYTLWENTDKGKDAQSVITSLCGEAGDKACRNSKESKTVKLVDIPQTKADFDGRLYELEMYVTAGMYKVMVAVTGS